MLWLLVIVRCCVESFRDGTAFGVHRVTNAWRVGTSRGFVTAPRPLLANLGRVPNHGRMHVGPVLKVCVDPLGRLAGLLPHYFSGGGLAWSGRGVFPSGCRTLGHIPRYALRFDLRSV